MWTCLMGRRCFSAAGVCWISTTKPSQSWCLVTQIAVRAILIANVTLTRRNSLLWASVDAGEVLQKTFLCRGISRQN